MTNRIVISAGQTFVMEAEFTNPDTGELANPTSVDFTVVREDWGGRYVTETVPWAGVDTPYVTNESTGVFRGVYKPDSETDEFTAKISGSGAITGASESFRVIVVP
jgi:hypothetical protein